MVDSLNRAQESPKYCTPYHRDPKKVLLILGNPHIGDHIENYYRRY